MFSNNSKISLKQLQALLILDIFGTAIITLPRRSAEIANQDGWIVLIIATIFASLYSYLLSYISSKYESLTFVGLTKKILGKPLGIIVSFGLLLKLIITSGLYLRIFSEIIMQTMLFKTPLYITALLMLLISGYVSYCGLECRGRMSEILFLIMFIPLIFVLILSCFKTDFTNLMPVLNTSPTTLLEGSVYMVLAFQNIMLFMIIYPFINKKEDIGKAVCSATTFIGVMFVFATAITIGRYGATDVKLKLWPILQIMNTVEIPGSFIERQDIIILWFWVVSVFSTISSALYLSSFIGSKITQKDNLRIPLIYIGIFFMLIIFFIPKNIVTTYKWLDFMNLHVGILYFFVIPILLVIVDFFKEKV